MADTDPTSRFDSLTERHKEVLRLFCKGISYKEIGEILFISESTVKSHIGHIYEKLGLLDLPPKERVARIFEIYCPLLKKHPPVPLPPEEKAEEPEPITPEVEKMVDEDENALVLWESSQIIDAEVHDLPPRPRRNPGCLWGLIGIVVGVGLIAGYFYFFGGGIPGMSVPNSPALQASPETPEPPSVSDTPVVIVVTATAIPASETPLPSETSLPTNTSVPPTATTAPSATSEADTQPDSVLEVGDWWKEAGLWLRLTSYHITTDIPGIRITMELWNKTDSTILFSWNTSGNLSMRDNNGYSYPMTVQFTNVSDNEQYDPGELSVLEASNLGATVFYQDDRLFDANVTELILTVSDLSKIDRAQFRIPLNK